MLAVLLALCNGREAKDWRVWVSERGCWKGGGRGADLASAASLAASTLRGSSKVMDHRR